jgi:transposase
MDVANLPNDPQLLKQILASQSQTLEQRDQVIEQFQTEKSKLESQIHEQYAQTIEQLQEQHKQAIEILKHRLALLMRRFYGPRAEAFDPAQLLLFAHAVEAAAVDEAEPAAQTPEKTIPSTRRAGHGRKPLPANLPRQRIEHPIDPKDVPCPCCGVDRVRIGEEISEQLEYVPASFLVYQHARPKLACKQCEANIAIAQKPAEPIEKGLPGPGLLAHVITGKYGDHLPLYRLEHIFARHGVDIVRSTMCGWMAAAATLLRPLHDLMATRVRSSAVIHTDDTPVPVQDPAYPGRTKTGRLWVYCGDESNPYVVYDYTPSRSGEGPAAWLGGFTGSLQADAFGGYDCIYASQKVTEVACWAHARRKFFEAKETDPPRCARILAMIGELYGVERSAKEKAESADDAQSPPHDLHAMRWELRQSRSLPILAKIKTWLDQQQPAVLPKSALGSAIGYTLKLWPALTVYATDGRLSIDNNASERALRRVALGRKNWLFAGSDNGGKTASILYSMIASAQQHGLDPEAYLRGVLARLASTLMSQIDQFLPDHWKAAMQTETQTPPGDRV